MQDDEIKQNIKKCSRCALCVQNCPIYQITKNENNTARGLICKLNAYEDNILNEKEIKKDLKICLNCSKCKSNCPSKVNTSYIFAYKNSILSPSKFSQRILLNIKLLPIKILYFLNFFKKKYATKKSEIFYFKGCISKAQHKTTFLDKVFYNPDFLCCGLPYFSGGDLKNYNKVKKKNIELIKKSKYVVFDCASCKSSIEEYSELDEIQKDKLLFFTDLIKEKKYKLKNNSKFKNKTITFHKPCHLSKKDFEEIEKFLLSIDNINYKKLENVEQCCGFGGSYFVFHPVVALKIIFKKAKDIKINKAELILTACPSCVLGLRFGQILSLNFKKTLELRDFIENELELA